MIDGNTGHASLVDPIGIRSQNSGDERGTIQLVEVLLWCIAKLEDTTEDSPDVRDVAADHGPPKFGATEDGDVLPQSI